MSPQSAPRPAEERRLLGDLLLEAGLVDRAGLRSALDAQRLSGGRLGWHLLRLGRVPPAPFHAFLDLHLEAMRPDLMESLRAGQAIGRIPAGLAHHYGMVPLRETDDGVLELGLAHADDPHLQTAVAALTGLRVEPIICPPALIGEALLRHYPSEVEPGLLFRAAGDNVLVLQAARGTDAATLEKSGVDPRPADRLRAIVSEAFEREARRIDLEPVIGGLDLAFTTGEGRLPPVRLPQGAFAGLGACLDGLSRIAARGRILPREGRFAVERDGVRSIVSVLAVPGLLGRAYGLDLRQEVVVGPAPGDLAATLPALRSTLDALAASGSGLLLIAVPGPAEWASALEVVLSLLGERLPRRAVRGDWRSPRQAEAEWPDADLVVDATPWRPGDGAAGIAAAGRQVVLAVVDAPDAFVAAEAIAGRLAGPGARAGSLKGVFSVRHLESLCRACRRPWEAADLALPPLPGPSPGPLWTASGCVACRGSGRFEVMRVGEFVPIGPGDLRPPRRPARRWREDHAARGWPTLGAGAMRAALLGCVEAREVLRLLLHEPH